jgi:hypothetical protein
VLATNVVRQNSQGTSGVARAYAGAAVIGTSVYVVGGDEPQNPQPAVPSAVVEVGVVQ